MEIVKNIKSTALQKQWMSFKTLLVQGREGEKYGQRENNIYIYIFGWSFQKMILASGIHM